MLAVDTWQLASFCGGRRDGGGVLDVWGVPRWCCHVPMSGIRDDPAVGEAGVSGLHSCHLSARCWHGIQYPSVGIMGLWDGVVSPQWPVCVCVGGGGGGGGVLRGAPIK